MLMALAVVLVVVVEVVIIVVVAAVIVILVLSIRQYCFFANFIYPTDFILTTALCQVFLILFAKMCP